MVNRQCIGSQVAGRAQREGETGDTDGTLLNLLRSGKPFFSKKLGTAPSVLASSECFFFRSALVPPPLYVIKSYPADDLLTAIEQHQPSSLLLLSPQTINLAGPLLGAKLHMNAHASKFYT